MILSLMRRHIATPGAIVLSCACAAMVAAWPELGPAVAVPLILPLWRLFPQRATLHEAALPISGRDVVVSRMLALLALVLFPLVIWIVAALARGAHGWSPLLMAEVAAIVTLAVLLPYTVRPGELSAPSVPLRILPWLVVALAGGAALYALAPLTGLLLFALAIAGTAAVIWMTTPESLQAAPAPGSAKAVPPRARADVSAPGRATTWWWAPLRTLFPVHMLVFVVLIIGSGAIGKWLITLCIGALSLLGLLRQRTQWMAALPLSIHARVLAVVAPIALALGASLALGHSLDVPAIRAWHGFSIGAPRTSAPGEYMDNPTAVPLPYWQRARGVPVAAIVSPWGESVPADTLSVFGVMLFDPYTTRVKSSERFVEWQFERATTAVYGRPIARAQYDQERPPRLAVGARLWVLTAAALFVLVLVMAWLTEVARWHGFAGRRRMTLIAAFLPSVPVFIVLAVDMKYGLQRGTDIVAPLGEAALRRLADVLPASLPALCLIAMLTVAAAYALVWWQFGRSESVDARVPLRT